MMLPSEFVFPVVGMRDDDERERGKTLMARISLL